MLRSIKYILLLQTTVALVDHDHSLEIGAYHVMLQSAPSIALRQSAKFRFDGRNADAEESDEDARKNQPLHIWGFLQFKRCLSAPSVDAIKRLQRTRNELCFQNQLVLVAEVLLRHRAKDSNHTIAREGQNEECPPKMLSGGVLLIFWSARQREETKGGAQANASLVGVRDRRDEHDR